MEPETRKDPNWTVMVFMGAGQIEGDADLVPYLKKDILEMESVISSGGPGAQLNVFLEIHGLPGVDPTRQWVGVNGNEREPVPSAGSGVDDKPILDFIDWAIKQAKPRRGDHTLLVLWGHAYRFALGREKTPTGVDALDVGEFAAALQAFQNRARQEYGLEPDEIPRLDIVGFDACDISTLELANQLQPFARYLIGSQIGIPLPGWPYDTILERLSNPRDGRPMSPPDFGRFAVRKFCEDYAFKDPDGRTLPVSLTLLDLDRAPEAFDAAEDLAGALATACGDDANELETVIEQFAASQTIEGKPFIDVADFCLNLSRRSDSAPVRLAAARLGNILIRPSLDSPTLAAPEEGARGSLIVEHGRNAHQTAKLHGVSLYAPHILGEAYDWRNSRFWYQKFDFTGETYWCRLVHVLSEGN